MKTNKLTSAVRLAIGAGAVTATMPVAQLATAQEQMIEEVVITGSRIKRPELEAVSPYTVIDSEEFKLSGTINVEQKLAELPSTLPSFGPSSNNPGDGTARVDLRGLGTSRTLVLVNGRRWIPATQTGVVDLNTIPGTLIKRVDVVTGGASAVYGSDALAGVVNFELIDDFEGAEITGLYDITDEGDAEKYNMDITLGGNFADGRGNAVVYASYSKREALFQGDRKFSTFALTESGGELVPGGSSGVPGTRIFGGPEVPGAGFNLGTFGPNGEALPWIEPDSRFNYAPDNFLQLPQERWLMQSFAHYEVNEHARAYAEAAYSYNKVPQELAPTPAFTTVFINPNSAFFAPETQAALNTLPADDDGNVAAFIGRRMVENGSRQAIDVRDAFRILVGVDGDINDNWSYDAYYSFSNLDNNQALNNDVSASRFVQAIATNDAGTACQDPSGGCVPLNIWGAGNISPEAKEFVNIGATNITAIEQEVISASIFGDLWTIPTAEYPVAIVFGYEHRRDESSFRPDTFLASGDVLGFNAGEATIGSYKSTEFFGEISVPLIQGAPLAEDLTLWGAARTSDYSNLDDRVNSFAAAINYAPIESLKFRVGYQEAVRAPNVAELFQGSANGFPGAVDPCSADGFQPGVTDTALCNSVGGGLGGNAPGGFEQANTQIEGSFGGNPNLEEETSETFTVGFVWTPLDSLDITVDYYDIEIEDAIGTLGGGVNNILDLCYNVVKQADGEYCQAISRRADGNVGVVSALNANTSSLETSGIDFNVYYSKDFGFGIGGNGSTLDINFNSTFLDDFTVTPVADIGDNIECAGYFGNSCGAPLPEIQWNTRATWRTGSWTFSGLLRYIGETDDDQLEDNSVSKGDLVVPTLDDEYYLDLTVSYAFEQGLTLSFGGTNILDTEPDKLGDSQEQANTFPSTYPLFGPRYFLSASYKF